MSPNPILQAFIAGHQGGLKLREQEQQHKERETRNAIEESARIDAQKRAEAEHELKAKEVNASLDLIKAKLAQTHLERKRAIGEMYRSGEIKPDAYSDKNMQMVQSIFPELADATITQPKDVITDQGETFRVDRFGNAQDMAKIAGEAALTAKKPLLDYGNNQAEELLRQRGQQATELEGVRQNNRLAVEEKKAGLAKDLQVLRNAGMENAAKIRAKAGVVAASIRSTGRQAQDTDSLAKDAESAAMGMIDATGKTKVDVNIRSVLNANGWKAFTPKKAEALKNISQFQGVLDDMNEFINKHGTNSTLGTAWNAISSSVPLIPTDIKADTERLKGRAAKVATFMGEIGRKTEGDIERALKVMTSPNQTKEQMEKARDTLIRDFSGGLKQILSGLPEDQQAFILEKYQVPEQIQHSVLGTKAKSESGEFREPQQGEEKLPNGEIIKMNPDGSASVVGRWRK